MFRWLDPEAMFEADTILFSIPLFPSHERNYELINQQPADTLAWSLFCANNITHKYDAPQFTPPTDVSIENLLSKADAPPAWDEKYQSVPLIGIVLNVMAQAQSYFLVPEDCADFIAADLEKGFQSEWVGKRVGIKQKITAGVVP